MKVRSLLELEEQLDKDLAWRKREFTTLKFMIEKARNHEKEVLVRSAVALLYAHWEGFLKTSAQAYVHYLNHLSPKYSEMKENFIQASLADKFANGFSVKKHPAQKEIYEYLTGSLEECMNIDQKRLVNTESNLKYDVLLNIMGQLGLDAVPFELKQNFIDSTMVDNRNSIAHGERLNKDTVESAYLELEKELLSMIVTFQNLVVNAAANKDYLK